MLHPRPCELQPPFGPRKTLGSGRTGFTDPSTQWSSSDKTPRKCRPPFASLAVCTGSGSGEGVARGEGATRTHVRRRAEAPSDRAAPASDVDHYVHPARDLRYRCATGFQTTRFRRLNSGKTTQIGTSAGVNLPIPAAKLRQVPVRLFASSSLGHDTHE